MDRYPPIPPELPPEPEGYNPDYFANRRYELRLIRRKVDEGLTKQPIIEPLVHIWGIRGMGKSWLMRHLDALYRFKPDEATVSILVDFSKSQFSHWVPSTITDLLQAVVDDIRIQLPEGKLQDVAQSELSAFQSELEEIGQDSKRTPTHLSETFVALICQLSRAVVPLLLFDTTEILDEDDFFWLESHLIEPIVRTDRVVVVVAGRKEIPRWREFGARQRLVVQELPAFEIEETREQLDKRGYGYLSDTVHSLSFGHPYAGQVLGEALHKLAAGRPTGTDFEETHHDEVLALLGQVEGELLRGVRSETHQDILRTLSALRRFNVGSVRWMLGDSSLEKEYQTYQQWKDTQYLDLFEKLEGTALVWWSTEQRGYVIGAPLRRIMDLRIQKGAKERFTQLHKRAQALYVSWIEEYPRNQGAFLLEALYHLTNILICSTPDHMQTEIETFLDKFMRPENFTTDGADAFYQLLQRDTELQNSRHILPKPVYEAVVQKARRFRDRIAGVERVEDS